MAQTSGHSVIPHQLCGYCKEFVRKHDNFDFFRAPDEASFNIWFNYDKEVEHYPNVQTLIRSAREQCHLCSILAAQLPDDYDQAENKPMRTHVRSQTFLCSNYGEDDLQSRQLEVELRVQGDESMLAFAAINPYKDSDMEFPDDPDDARRSTYTGDGAHVSMIRKWLEECMSTHEACNDVRYQHFKPTRVLDLQLDSSQDIRLVSGEQAGDAPYVTLSYCWGLTQSTTTTPERLDEFQHRIPFDTLPKTMRDAVLICRSLSIRYLWIDALCIVQGPHGDFHHEASRMQAVYAGSLFTISAADATSSTAGCLFPRLPLAHFDLTLPTPHGPFHLFSPCTALCPTPSHQIPTCALNTRGWVFQERLLAPRSLAYTRRGIHFECRHSAACEKHRDLATPPDRATPHRKHLYAATAALAREPDERGFRRTWAQLVNIYSQTALSFAKDKLPAIAGIAALVADNAGAEMPASFGHWLRGSFFADQLLWRPDNGHPLPDPPTCRSRLAPSWSWPSFDGGAVLFDQTLHAGEVEPEGWNGDVETLLREWEGARVVGMPRATAWEAPPGEEEVGGYGVRLRAPVEECWVDRESWMPFLVPVAEGGRGGAPANVRAEGWRPDVEGEEEGEGGRLFCVLVRREHRRLSGEEGVYEKVEEWALVVAKVGGEGGDGDDGDSQVYRRVGLIKYFLTSSSDEWEKILSPEDGMPHSLGYMFTPETPEREVTIV